MQSIIRNEIYLRQLFSGPFLGHAITIDALSETYKSGLYAVSNDPVSDWLPVAVRNYEQKIKSLEEQEDDSVPYAAIDSHKQ
jgi:hypothetical protein